MARELAQEPEASGYSQPSAQDKRERKQTPTRLITPPTQHFRRDAESTGADCIDFQRLFTFRVEFDYQKETSADDSIAIDRCIDEAVNTT